MPLENNLLLMKRTGETSAPGRLTESFLDRSYARERSSPRHSFSRKYSQDHRVGNTTSRCRDVFARPQHSKPVWLKQRCANVTLESRTRSIIRARLAGDLSPASGGNVIKRSCIHLWAEDCCCAKTSISQELTSKLGWSNRWSLQE